ncbi:MAG: 7-cyano-7-deazaguanine synthase [Bacteroidia bacterium]|nr:7-cyano-7-deazaguanine synthase [Bacteroidia bacterium]
MKTCVLLFSGGVDSTTTLDMLVKDNFNVYPLYIDYGQKALRSEIEAVKYFIKKYNINQLKIVKTSTYKDIQGHPLLNLNKELDIASTDLTTSKNFLHFRNLTFACIAAIYSREVNAENIAFGFINKSTFNSFPDTSPDFVKKLNDLLNIIEPDFPIKIIVPCISLTKKEIVKHGIHNNISLNKTYSCYESKRCYKCESCLDVLMAFDDLSLEINIKDLKRYNPYKLITE